MPIRPTTTAPATEPAPAQLAAEAAASYIATRTPHWDKTPPATRYARLAEHALLNMKICHPACGSGHFLIAAAHRLAKRLAAVRTGDEEPAPDALRHALRDVISHCIYGVDINPMVVELCKINLWLESLEPSKPLSFLDHHIQCGNSLLGTTPALLANGIPDEAFTPIEGDEKTACSQLKKENKRERQDYASGQGYLFEPPIMRGNIAAEFAKLTADSENTAQEVASKEDRYARLVRSVDYETARLWADTWSSVFVWKKDKSDLGRLCPTERKFRDIERNPHNVLPMVRTEIKRLREQYQLLHWHLAFPDVFGVATDGKQPANEPMGWSGGFDVVLGNPPWERIKLQEKEWFADRSQEITKARNAAERRRMIASLQAENPGLFGDFSDAVHRAEGESHIVRNSGRFPLCGRGDVNRYTVFVELMYRIIGLQGRAGCVVPSGVATDDTTKDMFNEIVTQRRLVRLFDFENRENIFPRVGHGRMKFCLLTLGAAPSARFAFQLWNTSELNDPERVFSLSPEDIRRLNPNTGTCPIFRTARDARITLDVYRRIPVLQKETRIPTDEDAWGIAFQTMFHMAGDSHRFRSAKELEGDGFRPDENVYLRSTGERWLPLYEAKMASIYDHRFGTYAGRAEDREATMLDTPSVAEHLNPDFRVIPRYWVDERDVPEFGWLLCFRDVTHSTNDRTVIAHALPHSAMGHSVSAVVTSRKQWQSLLLANFCSLCLDYVARQKLGGLHLSFFIAGELKGSGA